MGLPANSKWVFIILVLFQVILVFINQHNILFWDTVQFAGKHGTYFFENGLSNGILLPDHIDSGHPPLFGFLVAKGWSLFGKSLEVSHWLMLPVLIGIVYQSCTLGQFLFPNKTWLFPVLLFVCPFYLGHSILVSPDLIVLFGFFLAINGLVTRRSFLVTIAVVIMCSISLRGAAISMALLLYDLYTRHDYNLKRFWKLPWLDLIRKYALGFIILTLYLIYHIIEKGWLVQHGNSSWAPSFESVGMMEMGKNVIRILWRLLDFGMVAIYLLLISKFRFLLLLKGRLFWLGLFLFIVLGILTVPYVGLVNHRYFLPIQIIALILGVQILRAYNRTWLNFAVIAFLLTGNFWIYPHSISQGWDSTYAHQPFYKMDVQFYDKMTDLGINHNEVGTAFPLRSSRKYISLDDSMKSYKQFDIKTDQYILYSNVMNEFKDLTQNDAFKNADVIHKSNVRGVEMILYKMYQ